MVTTIAASPTEALDDVAREPGEAEPLLDVSAV
jgi:hypothetical protein